MKKSLFLIQYLFFISVLSHANNYYVTTAADTGAGSLRVMMDSANAHHGLDTIVLNLTSHDTIYLGSVLPVITDSLVITGLSCQNPTISGQGIAFSNSPVAVSDTGTFLTLNYLNISNCLTNGAQAFGAVYGGHLYLHYCYFYNNSYSQPGGNFSAGAVCAQSVWAYNSSFNNDSCTAHQYSAGALRADSAYLFNCTFINNYALHYGGAINADYLELQNCTLTGNYAAFGGGIYSAYPLTGTVIANSIIWGNTSANLPGVQFTNGNISGGCNILQDTAAVDSFMKISSDVVGVDPQFGAFGYYAGCVPVLPILCGSIAQNHAACAGATDTDAQGIAAVGARDAGAFEITYPHLYPNSPDTIQPGSTADLYDYFNTTGLTIQWPGTQRQQCGIG